MTDRRHGYVNGQPTRFIRGHGGAVVARRRRHTARVQLEWYAEELELCSERIIGAVHDDGPDELRAAIAAALRVRPPPGVDPVDALVTVLAAQVDPSTTAEERLGWTRHFGTNMGLVRRSVNAPTPAGEESTPGAARRIAARR